MSADADTRAAWLAQLHSTEPANRPRAEAGVRALYEAAGFGTPRHFFWFDSPFAASWAVAVLAEPHHFLWGQKLAAASRSRDDRPEIDRARAALGAQLGIDDWHRVIATVGAPLGSTLRFPPGPGELFKMKLFEAQYTLSSDVTALMMRATVQNTLRVAESRFWGSNLGALPSPLHCPTTESLLGASFVDDYPFATMADDEELAAGREVPPILRAAWDVARSAGMWWPFEHAAVLSDRPAEIHVNAQHLLQRGDGPAVVYRDGRRAYAWNGKAVPERWILEPEKIPPRDLKGFDPTFRAFVESKVGKPAKAKKAPKAASILETPLPLDHAARLAQLTAHAGGTLPLLARYQAGDHRGVWAELVALGPNVRGAAHAADALAVAYETMRRVDANVRTLVARLAALGYRFTPEGRGAPRPHVPPNASTAKQIVAFEKRHGPLPLSLRAFYEVVGEVNLIGRHPVIDPAGNTVAPDPLVVYGFDDRLAEYDDDDDETPSAITIAPDDLHKADTSGGDAYEMTVPNPAADGELLSERHRLLFVDYLRLAFRFGGFSGYEGVDAAPPKLSELAAGLEPF